MTKKIWIILFNCFEFGWQGSTLRLIHIYRALSELGYDVVIISQEFIEKDQNDINDDLKFNILKTKNIYGYPLWLPNVKFFRKFVRLTWRLRGYKFYFKKISLAWGESVCIKSLIKNQKKPDLVWSMSGGLLNSVILGDRISREFRIPHVIEFHDPPIHAGLGKELSFVKGKLDILLNNSSKIVVNTFSYKNFLIKNYRVDHKKINLLYQIYNNDNSNIVIGENDFESVKIGYFGSLSHPRSLLPLAKAIVEIRKRDFTFFDKLYIILAGSGQGFVDFLDEAKRFSFLDKVTFLGQITQKEVIEYTAKCSILIINQPSESDLELPGKLFDTIVSKRVVLGIGNIKSETADLILNSNRGFVYYPDDIDGIVNFILNFDKYLFNENHGNDLSDFLKKFSYGNLKIGIDQIISEVLVKKSNNFLH